jgi:hypothetical protein
MRNVNPPIANAIKQLFNRQQYAPYEEPSPFLIETFKNEINDLQLGIGREKKRLHEHNIQTGTNFYTKDFDEREIVNDGLLHQYYNDQKTRPPQLSDMLDNLCEAKNRGIKEVVDPAPGAGAGGSTLRPDSDAKQKSNLGNKSGYKSGATDFKLWDELDDQTKRMVESQHPDIVTHKPMSGLGVHEKPVPRFNETLDLDLGKSGNYQKSRDGTGVNYGASKHTAVSIDRPISISKSNQPQQKDPIGNRISFPVKLKLTVGFGTRKSKDAPSGFPIKDDPKDLQRDDNPSGKWGKSYNYVCPYPQTRQSKNLEPE